MKNALSFLQLFLISFSCVFAQPSHKSDTAKDAGKVELKGKVDNVNVPTENKMKSGALINFL
jgi:hypothetical protein